MYIKVIFIHDMYFKFGLEVFQDLDCNSDYAERAG